MKRVTKIIASMMSVLLLSCSFGDVVNAAGVSMVADEEGFFMDIPTTYEVETTYKNLGEYGFLNHAEDLFMDSEDNLYVADSGNNRVLKISPQGEVLKEYTEAFGTPFKNPKGLYVHEDGTIWVADTDNYRVARINQDGSDVEMYTRPESDLLEESFTFSPGKIYVSHTGYMYV